MTNVIRVTFGDNMDDNLYCGRLRERLHDLKRVLQKSVKLWKISEDKVFDDAGSLVGEEFVFVVDEFYVTMVKDMVNTLDSGNYDWRNWFRKKHEVSCVG